MIRLNNVSIGYEKKHPLKTELNFEFKPNTIYSLVGRSGKGKTTLLKTIAGLTKQINGDIITYSHDPKKKLDIYMMHQNYTCFDWLTCYENIAITCKILKIKVTEEINNKINNLLKEVGLFEYKDCFPTQLSGGMRQRLALARTMFVNPSVILMDEPLSALDKSTRKAMQNLILQHHRDTKNTIIMITHSQEEAMYMSDEIIDFDKI